MGRYSQYTPSDPEFAALKSEVDQNVAALWRLPLAQMKEVSYQDLPLPDTAPKVPEDVQIEDIFIPMRDGFKIEARIYKTKDTPKNAIMNISYHGGGWVTGKHTYEEWTNRCVAFSRKAVVLSPLYRLAPEYPFPTPFDDCVDTLRWAIGNAEQLGADATKIVVSGSSAGGNLSAAIALYARDQKISGIVGQVLNIPATCCPQLEPEGLKNGSLEENKDASVLTFDQLMWFWNHYVGTEPTPDARHSPLLAESLNDLPPTLVQVAGQDTLRDQGIEYAEALKNAGNKVQLEIFPGVPHGFGTFVGLSAAQKYQDNVVAFFKTVDSGSL